MKTISKYLYFLSLFLNSFQLILCSYYKWHLSRIPRLDKVNVKYFQCEIHKSSLLLDSSIPVFWRMVFSNSFGVQSNETSSLQLACVAGGIVLAKVKGGAEWVTDRRRYDLNFSRLRSSLSRLPPLMAALPPKLYLCARTQHRQLRWLVYSFPCGWQYC